MKLTGGTRLTRILVRLLAPLLVLGVVAVSLPAPASADEGGRGFYIPGAFGKVSAGDSLTFKAYMDDYTPVPTIYVDPASAAVCTITGYDRSSWDLTVSMLAGGTCTIWYEYTANVLARSDIPVDPHRQQGVTVTGTPDTVPLSAGQATFTAYSDGDHGPLDDVEALTPPDGHQTCQVAGYDPSTYRVSVNLIRGGVCTVRLARDQTDAYYASSRDIQFNVSDPRGNQAISWSPIARTPAWGDTPLTLDGVASSGLPITYTSSTPNLCTVDGDTLHIADANALLPNLYGSCTVTASQDGTDQWYPADSVTHTIDLFPSPRTQTVSWPDDPYRYLSPGGGAQLTLQANVSSGRPLSYVSLTPWNCTVSGNVVTAKVVYVRDTCTVRATAPGAYGSWNSASADVDITMIETARPPDFYTNQLAFPQIPDRTIVAGPFGIEAKGALPVHVYTQSAGVCTVSGTTITPHAVGTCTLQAIQDENQYQPPVAKVQSFQITTGQQTMDYPAIPDRVATDAPFTLTATASSGLPVSFTSTTPDVCSVTGDTVTLGGVGTCTVQAEAGNDIWVNTADEQSFQVTAAAQTLDFPAIPDRVATDGAVTLTATASSGLPVTFTSATPAVCSVADGAVTLGGVGTCTVRAEAGNSIWADATGQRSFQITAGQQTIDFPAILDHVAGDAPFTLTATASSGLPVTFTSTTPDVCSVTGDTVTLGGVGTCTVRVEAGNDIWATATDERSFQVTAADQRIQLSALPGTALSTRTVTVVATSSRGLPVTLTTTTPTVCSVTGLVVVLRRAGTCTIRATQDGTPSVHATSVATTSFPVWATPKVPSRSRMTEIVTVLGRGESALRVVTSTPTCRVSGARLVVVSAGACRATVLGTGNRVVRRVVSTVTAAPVSRSTSHLARTRQVYFARGSAKLSHSEKVALRAQARNLRGAKLVVVYGHRSAGEPASRARARSRVVSSYLRAWGVKATVVTVGLGAKRQAGRRNHAKGRRVDVFCLR